MKKYAVAVFTAVGLMSLPVVAAEDSGFYAGAGIGFSNLESESIELFEGDGGSIKLDDDDMAWKLFGGWRLNKYIAFELDYFDLGSFTDTTNFDIDDLPLPTPVSTGGTVDITTTADLTGFAPYVVGTWPVGMFEISGKLGYAFWDADLNVCGSNQDLWACEDTSEDGEDFAWGVGAGVTLLDNINVKVEYEGIEIEDADVSIWWLTGAWRF
jgi:opacity protein-like surface antigen